jgi:hypothetical protein
VSDVVAKVGERAVMQAKLRVRDGYRILQSYNNRRGDAVVLYRQFNDGG